MLHRVLPSQIAEMAALQTRLLARAGDWVRPGGLLVFTVEALPGEGNEAPFALQPHGRYSHRSGYVRAALDEAGGYLRAFKDANGGVRPVGEAGRTAEDGDAERSVRRFRTRDAHGQPRQAQRGEREDDEQHQQRQRGDGRAQPDDAVHEPRAALGRRDAARGQHHGGHRQ